MRLQHAVFFAQAIASNASKAPQVVVKTTFWQNLFRLPIGYRGLATSPAYTSTQEKGACPPREYVTTIWALNGATYPPLSIFALRRPLGRKPLRCAGPPIEWGALSIYTRAAHPDTF